LTPAKVIAVCVALAAIAAGAADAGIAPQVGIRGVALGMSRQAVLAALGTPSSVRHGTNELGRWTSFRYPGLAVTFAFDQGVSQVATTSPADRTPHGIGVGSRAEDVQARVKGVKCVREAGYSHCYVGTWRAGARFTDFSIRNGRVVRVVIGRLLD
jgi:hypothetical protein